MLKLAKLESTIRDQQTFTDKDVRNYLASIEASQLFAASPRSLQFLSYIVSEHLEGRSGRLNGTTIAQDVFGKGSDFNATIDPIVRVQAQRLRKLLAEYYHNEGRDDPLRLTMPKGQYRPVFHNTKNTSPQETKKASVIKSKWLIIALTAVLGVIITVFAIQTETSKATTPSVVAPNYPRIAVLPFENKTGLTKYDIWNFGFQKRVVIDLARFKAVLPSEVNHNIETLVIEYKDQYDYILSGALLSADDEVDVEIKLLSMADRSLVLDKRVTKSFSSEGYYNALKEISSNVGNDVASLNGVLIRNRQKQIKERISTSKNALNNSDAFDCFAQYQDFVASFSLEKFKNTYACVITVSEAFPEDAMLLAIRGRLTAIAAKSNPKVLNAKELDPNISSEFASNLIQKAARLDPMNSFVYDALSQDYFVNGNLELAIEAGRISIDLNPGDIELVTTLSHLLAYQGDWKEVKEFAKIYRSRIKNPSARFYNVKFLIALHDGDGVAAMEAAKKIKSIGYHGWEVHIFIAAAMTQDKKAMDATRAFMEQAAERNGGDIITAVYHEYYSKELQDIVAKLMIENDIPTNYKLEPNTADL